MKLYDLFGLRENEWDDFFSQLNLREMNFLRLTITIKEIQVNVGITGEGSTLSLIWFEGKEILSAIVPNGIKI